MASIGDQNWIIWNQGKNPLVNFNFMLRVELAVDLPCKSVRAFQRELEYDYIQEGGLNDYVHMRRKPITKPFTLEVERYVGVDYVDPLPLGADLVLPVMLFVSRAHDQFIPGVVARTYIFTGCTVMKKTYGDLVADQSGLLVETTTLGYREMLCVDIPWSEVGDNMFGEVNNSSNNLLKDKSGAELKVLGQELYERAKEAKLRAETEFDSEQADKLIGEMETALKELEKSIALGGRHSKLKDRAEAAMEKDGKSLKQQMEEAIAATRAAEEAFDQAEPAYLEKEQASRQAQQEKADLEARKGEAEKRKTALEEEKKALEAQRDEIQKDLPEGLRDPKTAEEARDKAQETMLEKRSAFIAARREYDTAYRNFNNEYDAAMGSVAPSEQNVKREEERNRLAQEALTEAENTYKQARQALEEAQQDPQNTQQAIDRARAELEAAQAELERRRKPAEEAAENLKQVQERLKQVQEKAGQLQEVKDKGPAEGSELASLTAALAAAEGALSDAQAALDTANAQLEDSRKLVRIQDKLDEITKQFDDADAEVNSLNGEITQAEDTAKDAATALAEQTEPYNTARTARDNAAAEQEAAVQAYSDAKRALDMAKSEYDRAVKQINPLHNSLTNLKARCDRVDEAQKSCGDQFKSCEEHNQTLQAADDSAVILINQEYREVQKTGKQTMLHERQVREMEQYMSVGAKALENAKAALEQAEKMSAAETTSGG